MDLSSILIFFRVRTLSRHPWECSGVPLGARVVPAAAQGAKSWFVGPPLASQNEVILESFLYTFSLENASTKNIDFLMILGLILNGFWVHFGCLLGCFSSIFSIPFSMRFCKDFGGFLRILNLDFCNTLHAKTRFFKFSRIRNLIENYATNH